MDEQRSHPVASGATPSRTGQSSALEVSRRGVGRQITVNNWATGLLFTGTLAIFIASGSVLPFVWAEVARVAIALLGAAVVIWGCVRDKNLRKELSSMKNKDEAMAAAMCLRMPTSTRTVERPTETCENILNGKDFKGVEGDGPLVADDVIRLLHDDHFVAKVFEVIAVVDHNTTPETIAAARFVLRAMRAEQKDAELEAATRKLLEAEEKKELEAAQPSYATEISQIVSRVTAPYHRSDDSQTTKGDDDDQQ